MRRIEQMVFVVEAGRTPQYLVTAIATLDSSKSINLVLKKRRKSFAGSCHGDYGYGRYGYGIEQFPSHTYLPPLFSRPVTL
jgi:hypothetical protein